MVGDIIPGLIEFKGDRRWKLYGRTAERKRKR